MRAAPTVSILLNAGSDTRIASSAPMASACLSASFADSGPMHNAVTVPLVASFCWSAPSTAYSSNGLMTSGASPHDTCPPSALTFASESGTCLIHAMIFKRILLVVILNTFYLMFYETDPPRAFHNNFYQVFITCPFTKYYCLNVSTVDSSSLITIEV